MIKEVARIEVYLNHNGAVCATTNIKDQNISKELKDAITQAGLEVNYILIDAAMKKAPGGTAIPNTGASSITQNQNIIKRKDCQP
jgi:hypothetical protein